MKKTVLIISCFLLILSQSLMALETHLGLKAGISRSKFDYKKDMFDRIDPMNSFTGGVTCGLDFNRSFGARVECVYNKKGGLDISDHTGPGVTPPERHSLLNYQGNSWTYRFCLFTGHGSKCDMRPYFIGGPSLAIKLKSEYFADLIPQLDGGIGISFSCLNVEARYYYSLTKYSKLVELQPHGLTLTLGIFSSSVLLFHWLT